MFRQIIRTTVLIAALALAGVIASDAANAWYSYGSYGYAGVPLTPYGYATAYGYAYPGAPYYLGYGPPYYPGYGPPYYRGYGPPYVGGYTTPPGSRYAMPYYYNDDVRYW